MDPKTRPVATKVKSVVRSVAPHALTDHLELDPDALPGRWSNSGVEVRGHFAGPCAAPRSANLSGSRLTSFTGQHMTILFDKVRRHRCPNDAQALVPPSNYKFPPFERLDDHREQVRAALWRFGAFITAAARYLRVDAARLRRFVNEIDPSLLEDIARIDAALTEYAQSILKRAKQARSVPELPKAANEGVAWLTPKAGGPRDSLIIPRSLLELTVLRPRHRIPCAQMSEGHHNPGLRIPAA